MSLAPTGPSISDINDAFTDPDTPIGSVYYKSIGGSVINWSGALPVDSVNGQKYWESAAYPSGAKLRIFQYGSTHPARLDETGVTSWPAAGTSVLQGQIDTVITDGTNDVAVTLDVYLDGPAATVPTTPPGTMAAPTVTAISASSISVARAAPPAPGDSPTIGYKYRYSTDLINWTQADDPVDPWTPTGLLASTLYYAQTKAYNSFGDGAWSQTGSATTAAASGTVQNQVARFGSKTPTGKGGYRPFSDAGVATSLSTYNSLVSGSLGAYVPAISATGGLIFNSGGAGAPNGAVLRCTLVGGGTVDLTVETVANAYHAYDITEIKTAYAAAVCGDTIYVRDGFYNQNSPRQILSRSASPAGWNGSNPFVITPELGGVAKFGALEVGSNGTGAAQYVHLTGLKFEAQFVATSNDGIGSTKGIFAITQGLSYVTIDNCEIKTAQLVTATTTGVLNGIYNNGGRFLTARNNVIDGNAYGITSGSDDCLFEDNLILRTQVDALACSGARTKVLRNTVTEKLHQATEHAVTGVTTGSTTTFTLAAVDSANIYTGQTIYMTGLGGMPTTEGDLATVASTTTTTVTVNYNSNGLTWTGGGAIGASRGLHGDYIQHADSMNYDGGQDDMEVIGNVWQAGQQLNSYGGDGQYQAGSGGSIPAKRRRMKVIGNVYIGEYVNGMNLNNLEDSLVASNTVIRQQGSPGAQNTITRIAVNGLNNLVWDNVSTGYSLGSTSIGTNNVTLPIVSSQNIPPSPSDAAIYTDAFVNPDLVSHIALTRAEILSRYAPKPGGTLDIAIVPGAIGGQYDQNTGIYTAPR